MGFMPTVDVVDNHLREIRTLTTQVGMLVQVMGVSVTVLSIRDSDGEQHLYDERRTYILQVYDSCQNVLQESRKRRAEDRKRFHRTLSNVAEM